VPCFAPLSAWRSKFVRPSTGKHLIVFKRPAFGKLLSYEALPLPCGQCIGCRLEYSRQWAIRCVHEADMHEDNCFVTLTFDNEHLNKNGSLVKSDFQNFMKRLRKHLSKSGQAKRVRFFHCGEYGETYGRPHHHVCLFGFDFPDKVRVLPEDSSRARRLELEGIKIYRSELLGRLWPFGLHEIGDVTFESAAYVARYVVKKLTGDNASFCYEGKLPEYVSMSRGGRTAAGENMGGIGRRWFEKFYADVYPFDEVVLRGKVMKPPKAYDRIYELDNAQDFDKIRRNRVEKAKANPHNVPERLRERHKLTKLRVKQLKRSL